MKTFWFSCQSNFKVGLGHLSRLVAIADELQSMGHVACFSHYSAIDDGTKNFLEAANFTVSCVCENFFDILVIDSYELEFLNDIPCELRNKVIQVVDDVSPNYMAMGYIQASPINYWKPMNLNGKIFLFDRNPILRKVYDSTERNFQFAGKFEILISLGAVENKVTILDLLLLELNRHSDNIDKVNILSGISLKSKLNLEFNKLPLNWITHRIDFPEVIPPVNYVICAAGVTAWEMIAIGVPGFVIAASDNQEQQLKYFLENGLRNGIQFKNQLDFQNSIKEILRKDLAENTRSIPVSLKNGRVEVSNWLTKL